MPFKSKKQLKYMFKFHPEIARRWLKEYGKKYLKRLPLYKRYKKKKK